MNSEKDSRVDIGSLPPDRKKKVRTVRSQLEKGTYPLAENCRKDETVIAWWNGLQK